jgi:hypothetical protein
MRVVPEHRGKTFVFGNQLTGEWFLRLSGANGEILMTSEGHKNKADVIAVRDRYFGDWDKANEDA